MAQHSASSERGDDRLATRVSHSPPGGLISGGIAILVMLLAVAGVLPRPTFLVGAAGLMVVAYKLDKRFKTGAGPPTPAASTEPELPPAAGHDDTAVGRDDIPAAPVALPPATPAPADVDPSPATATATATAPPVLPSAPPPSLLAIGDLKAEHARLTRELTDRVDDDEDVRFEKFMRLRRIEEEIERQQGAPPS